MITPSTMRWGVPVLAALFTLPSWYQALVQHSAPAAAALTRFVVALPLAWVLLSLVRAATRVPDEVDDHDHKPEVPLPGPVVVTPPVEVSPQEESAA